MSAAIFEDVPDARRRNMAAIRGRDTKPEMIVRRLLHGLGYRYRLQGRGLPGRPDIVFAGRRKIIQIHGCYWHRHGCSKTTTPKARQAWWEAKFEANIARDARNLALLEDAGWSVLTVWECEMRDRETLASQLVTFLGLGSQAGPSGRGSQAQEGAESDEISSTTSR